jgi:hypothetical protein
MVSRTVAVSGLVVVFGVLAVILVYWGFTGDTAAGAAANINIGVLLLGLVIIRLLWRESSNFVDVVMMVAFLVAGIAVGYRGVSMLFAIPTTPAITIVADIALIVAGVFGIYQIGSS